MKKLLILLTLCLLNGCSTTSTVTPDITIHDRIAPADSSALDTLNGWIIDSLWDTDGNRTHAIISEQACVRYCALVDDYRLQYFERYKMRVAYSDCVQYKTSQGYEAWIMDLQHFESFKEMSRWNKRGVEPDSIWAKAKNLIK